MNALVCRKADCLEIAQVPANENNELVVQVAELRADVRHIQSDVTEMKAQLVRINTRCDSIEQNFAARCDNLDKKFDARCNKLEEKFDARCDKLEKKFDARCDNLDGKLDKLKDSLASAKLWAFGLYVTGWGTMLYVLAKGFKWI